MQLMEVTERAKTQLAAATNLRPLLVSGADREGSEWRLWVEMVELERIPEAQDLIGAYEVRLNEDGDLLNWRRTALRRRDETEWTVAVVAAGAPPRVLDEEGR